MERSMSSPEGGAGQQETSPKLPRPIYNWMSLIGSLVAVIGATVSVFLVIVGLATSDESGYSGLLLIFPIAFAGLGVALVAAGYFRERWRQKRGRHSSFFERTVVDPWGYVGRTGLLAILAGVIVGTFAILGAGAGSSATRPSRVPTSWRRTPIRRGWHCC
jgi:hypothetical protein